MDVSGVPEQSRLDRLAGANRTACGGFGAPVPRPRASAPLPSAMRCRCESRSQPTNGRVSSVSNTARGPPAKESGTARSLETEPPRPSSLDSLPPSATEIISAVAGRLPISAQRPPHPKGLDSPSLIAKRPARQPARGHGVWGIHRLGLLAVSPAHCYGGEVIPGPRATKDPWAAVTQGCSWAPWLAAESRCSPRCRLAPQWNLRVLSGTSDRRLRSMSLWRLRGLWLIASQSL